MKKELQQFTNAEKEIAYLAAIIQFSQDAIVSKTLDGIVTSWNPAAERLFGYTAEEMIGESITKIIPPDRLNEEPGILELIRRGERIEHFDTIRQHKTGRMIDISLTISPIRNTMGTIIGVSKIARDITKEREITRALEESEQRLQIAIQSAQLGTWEVDLKTHQATYSDRYLEILGFLPSEKPAHEELVSRIHPDDRALRQESLDRAMQTGVLDVELRIITSDNNTRWIRSRGKVFYNERGPDKMLGTLVDITAQKETEQSIQYRNALLEAHNEATSDGILLVDKIGSIISYNKRFLEIWNMPRDIADSRNDMEVSTFVLKQLVNPQQFIDSVKYLYENPGEVSVDELLFHDGKIIERHGYPVMGQEGSHYAWSWVFRDVTRQRHIDQALKESEERFKTIANTAPVMIWMSGNDKFSDFFNISWLNFTGRSIAQEMGDGWLTGVHPEDVQQCIDIYKEAYDRQKAFSVEYRLRRYDGKYRWISDNAVPRVTPEGKFIGFISACRDIDDEKRFNEKLRESELLFKTITNVSPVGLWMTDANGKNSFVNDTWIEWTGVTPAGQLNEGWLGAVIEADKDYVTRKFDQQFANTDNFSAEFRIKRKDGETRWVLSEGSPYYDIDGNFAGYAGSMADITERKQDEIRKNDFLAVASHELKTPLTSVKAYAQLLSTMYEKNNDAFLKNALNKVDHQVNKMTKLVGDFLNLSKIESDKFQLNSEVFDMYDLVSEIATDIQLVSTNHNIVIGKKQPVRVNADREKISQVITNFLNNAIKYSPEDKNIIISVEKENGHARVSVSDKGIGIKPEEQDKIFERFYRSKFNNNISFSGFGIGLYISAEIIHRHDGEIGVYSDHGQGATFYFTLPVAN